MIHKKLINHKELFCYQHKSFYIFSLPKIASSWLYQFFKKINGYDFSSELFDANVVNIDENTLTLSVNQNDNITSFIPKDILNDWNSEKSGIVTNKDFIFLIRNPIDKFFGGFMQDVILPKFHHDRNRYLLDSPENLEIIKNYSNKHHLNQFIEYNRTASIINSNWFLNLNNRPSFVHDVISYLIDSYVDKFFSNPNNIKHYRTDHKTSNLFLCYKLLFNSNFNKIKIIDIDIEDINSVLTNNYNIDISLIGRINQTNDVFKSIVEASIVRYFDIISILIETDILLYCDILNKVYGLNLTPTNLYNKKIQNL